MSVIIDARGLTCPQPVILTKKALAKCSKILVLIDDMVALDNVKKLAASQGCTVEEEQDGKEFRLSITRGETCDRAEGVISNEGPIVLVISSETMGRGEDVLGAVLMKSFLHTLMESTPMPDIMIFFNTGVKLAAQGSEVLEDLDALSKAGVRILVCGTCLNYFGLKDKLQSGRVSNMYDIAQSMFSAGRLVQI
jgi:selenium metabolism protein YedF